MKYKLKEGKQLTMYDLVNTKWHTTVENRDFLLFYFTSQGFANSHYNGDKRCEPYLFVHATNVEIQWGIGGRGTYDDSNHRAMKFDDWFEEVDEWDEPSVGCREVRKSPKLKNKEITLKKRSKDEQIEYLQKKVVDLIIDSKLKEGSFMWAVAIMKKGNEMILEEIRYKMIDGEIAFYSGDKRWCTTGMRKHEFNATDWEIFEEKNSFEKQLDDFVSDVLSLTEIKTNSEPSKEFMIKMRRLCDAHTKEFDKIKLARESSC